MHEMLFHLLYDMCLTQTTATGVRRTYSHALTHLSFHLRCTRIPVCVYDTTIVRSSSYLHTTAALNIYRIFMEYLRCVSMRSIYALPHTHTHATTIHWTRSQRIRYMDIHISGIFSFDMEFCTLAHSSSGLMHRINLMKEIKNGQQAIGLTQRLFTVARRFRSMAYEKITDKSNPWRLQSQTGHYFPYIRNAVLSDAAIRYCLPKRASSLIGRH